MDLAQSADSSRLAWITNPDAHGGNLVHVEELATGAQWTARAKLGFGASLVFSADNATLHIAYSASDHEVDERDPDISGAAGAALLSSTRLVAADPNHTRKLIAISDSAVMSDTEGGTTTFSFYGTGMALTKRVTLRDASLDAAAPMFVDGTGLLFIAWPPNSTGATHNVPSLYRLHDDGTATLVANGAYTAWRVG